MQGQRCAVRYDRGALAVGYMLSLMIYGGVLSILFLHMLNRRGHRSLHDLVVGSSVVTA